MTANPLGTPTAGNRGSLGIDGLRAYCDRLNRMEWVRASGTPYFIKEWIDEHGEQKAILERNG